MGCVKSERDGDGVWMMKALGLRREVGHVATSGLAGVPETSRRKVWRFLQNRPELGFGSFPKTAPVKIPEGRVAISEGLRRVEANYSKSSQPSDGLQCIFSGFAPKGFLV